mgnify:CR=1 FL=1
MVYANRLCTARLIAPPPTISQMNSTSAISSGFAPAFFSALTCVVTPSAAIAKQAIPQCHLVFIAGADMAPAISDYFMVLYEVDPAAVGGALPDDAIYYVP